MEGTERLVEQEQACMEDENTTSKALPGSTMQDLHRICGGDGWGTRSIMIVESKKRWLGKDACAYLECFCIM